MKNKPIAPLVPVLLVALGLLVAPLASAATSPSVHNGVVHACMKAKGKRAQRGMIRIVGPSQKCNVKHGWKALNWNIAGAAGARGDAGPQGLAGATGANGSDGAEGKQGEKGSAATVENQLKEVIASQAKEIEKLNNEVSTLSGGVSTALATANSARTSAETATTEAGEAVTSVATLTGKVTGQCAALNEVSTQANELAAGVSELTGALNLVLGGFLPKLPENSEGVTC
jgi:hypothetical protein